jgi:hypothetical protein
MPKKTDTPMTPEEQRRRFEEAARAIEADGGLSPDEAAAELERNLTRILTPQKQRQKHG